MSTIKQAQLFNDHILVELDDSDQQLEGGLYVAKSEGERTEAWAVGGVVVLLPLEKNDMSLTKGDKIYMSKWEYHKVMIDGKQYAFVALKNILMKIPK